MLAPSQFLGYLICISVAYAYISNGEFSIELINATDKVLDSDLFFLMPISDLVSVPVSFGFRSRDSHQQELLF